MSTFQFFIGVGAVVAGWIAYGAAQGKHFGTPLQWRLPLAFQSEPPGEPHVALLDDWLNPRWSSAVVAPAIPLVFLTFFMPESPRWLMIKGEHRIVTGALECCRINFWF